MRRRGRRLPIAAESFHLRVCNNWFAARVCGLTGTARVTLMQHFHTSWMCSQALLICLFCVRIFFKLFIIICCAAAAAAMTRPVRTVHSDHGVNHGCLSVLGVICRIHMRPRRTTKNKTKELNDATIESRMTAIERLHTQAIEMGDVRVVQQQQAKCNWKVTKKKQKNKLLYV